MELFFNDFILGTFRASDYGFIVGSFSYGGESEDDIGMSLQTIEEFIGHNPVPVYLGQKYTDKLKPQITLVKNPCIFYEDLYFDEKDCRSILRLLTGIRGYQWLRLIPQRHGENLWYKARINSVSFKRIDGHVAGLILNMECDSCFAWSEEYNVTIHAKAGQHFCIYNSTDDLNNYVYPVVSLRPSSAGLLSITNLSDGNLISRIDHVQADETITVDSGRQILTSDPAHDLLLDDFNLKWFRLLPGKNEYVTDSDITVSFRYRVPRKAGIVE